MAKKGKMSAVEYENAMVDDIGKFFDDPLGFVYYIFPWGEGELKKQTGPDDWQAEHLEYIGEQFRKNPKATIRDVTASGHGSGKSAVVAWLILWAMSTRPHLSGVVTANTALQLSSKTWRELSVWHKRSLNKDWFVYSATKIAHKAHPETWFCVAVPNSETNTEGFAGLHAEHVLIIYDEASAIPDKIWEVSEGAMSTPGAIWLAYGNPTRATGRFRECFDSDHRWHTRRVDTRTCKMVNQEEIEAQIKVYGISSDFTKVRILGQFPNAASTQLIPTNDVDLARLTTLDIHVHHHLPVVLGVDVARFGDDHTVVIARQGRKVLGLHRWARTELMETSRLISQLIQEYSAINGLKITTFVDGVGLGAGVVDRLRMLSFEVIEVNAGAKPSDPEQYFNKRIEMWDKMRAWLHDGADIPEDTKLRAGLIGIEYGFNEQNKMQLERKADMKKRLPSIGSPDEGDALAHTFAEELGDMNRQYFEPESEFEPAY